MTLPELQKLIRDGIGMDNFHVAIQDDHALATYDEGDQFDHSAAIGFIQIFGQALRTQAQVQLLGDSGAGPSLLPPRAETVE